MNKKDDKDLDKTEESNSLENNFQSVQQTYLYVDQQALVQPWYRLEDGLSR